MPQTLGTFWKTFIPHAKKSSTALPSITEHLGEFRGKRVLVRASLNVPVRDGKVLDDYRIRAVVPTIEQLRSAGARVIIVAHIGRDPELTLQPVCAELSKHVPTLFISDVVGKQAQEAVAKLRDGEVLMLENVRSQPGEMANTEKFAHELAALGDVYVNEAFAVSHREHTSIVGVPKLLPHYAGLQFAREVENLTCALAPEHPSLFILGGAKFETKKPLIEKFLGIYDTLFIGGAIANDFYSAMGYSIGVSASSKDARGLTDIIGSPNILLPIDVYAYKDGKTRVTTINSIEPDEYIIDIGPKTVELLRERISQSRYVLWNGPLGDTSMGYAEGTEGTAKLIADSNADSIVGGGDTVAAIARLHLEDKLTFLSTGGGAMLQFLANETLPGIEALRAQ